MFYWLLYEKLYHLYSPFRVFQYATFRTGMASLTAMLLSILLGPWMIARLRQFQIGQHIREDGPKSHQKKAGTPTMGGLLIGVSIVLPDAAVGESENPGRVGALAGLIQFRRRRVSGRLFEGQAQTQSGFDGATQKFAWEVAAALLVGVLLLGYERARGVFDTSLNVPFLKKFKPDLLMHAWLTSPWTYPLAFVFFFGF